jgi:UDP-N-acetylglucosamine--N-acetylmuramyl-(pentapeptide) pyrophosphoryl-undecaprenol N-acetylglucosamine transferase
MTKTVKTVNTANNDQTIEVLLATGGTGGHIFPAIALAKVLRGHGVGVGLIGVRGGMEEGLAAREQLAFFGVQSGKLDRSRPDPRALWRAAAGFIEAIGLVGRLKPAAIVGFGGFASFPGVMAALVRGIPLLLHESNVQPGLVTRLAARAARVIALTDLAAASALPPANQRRAVQWVGMPVREVRHPRSQALAQLGLDPNRPLLLVMGGSQGSVKLNALLPNLIEAAVQAGKLDVQVLHQTGAGRREEVTRQVGHLPWYHSAEFVDGPLAWSASSVAITRAGFSTIADAAYHGVPLILVPLPSASEDHQTKNAQAVVARGAGLLVPQASLEAEAAQPSPAGKVASNSSVSQTSSLPESLVAAILTCFDPAHQAALAAAARSASPEGAAQRLAALVLGVMPPKPTGGD